MKERTPLAERMTIAGIILPGALGLAVLARTLPVYWGGDSLAAALVVAMGAALAVGLVELVMRARRAYALEREVKTLPAQPSEDRLEVASPILRNLLRARLENAPPAPLSYSITPYLVGLLVMLGLLGTLLGLFESLGGAGQALAASADVEALREGLSGPVRGLTRSFGCSAAGISASAMLGLSAVVVRRAEGRALAAVYAYAAGPLRGLSPFRRQLKALDQLAAQGAAFPRAAEALETAVARLSALADRWVEAQSAAGDAQRQGLERAVDKMAGELGQISRQVTVAVRESVAPAMEAMIVRTGETAARQLEGARTALDGLADRIAQSSREGAAQREQELAVMAELTAKLRDALQALSAGAGTRHEAEQALNRHAEAAFALMQRSATALDTSLAQHDALVQKLGERAAQQLAQVVEAAHITVARSAETLEGALARHAEAAQQLHARTAQQLVQVVETAQATVGRSAETLEGALARQAEAAQQLHARTAQQLAQVVETAQATVGRSAETLEGALARHADLAQQLHARTAQQLAQVVETAQATVARSAQALEGTLSGQEQLARSAFERSADQVTQLSATAQELLSHAAQTLEAALSRQDGLVQSLLDRGAQQIAQLSAAAQEGAREALERIVALTEQQAERLVALEDQLSQGRVEQLQGLSQELSAHAERLGKGLEGTGQLVSEAAHLLRASGAEMSAVAEAFTHSIERQREAARTWLETLGELDGAVERAGRGAAADALGDQLASTQEVFARQLQFQRELFEQLRSLKAGATASRKGEQDVSA